ncbi:MAG TPA: HDOD domain-containing protein [Spirochaetota bacterium]|nr:HDOD domain-containing protein [Spirochaetota bacterium]HPJ35995.1 HDOD domain-containing protein [Spirochaetota bacterium]
MSEQVLNGEKVRLTFHYNNREITKFVNSVFTKILAKTDMLYLQGPIENVTRELIINAVKANSKRIYFKTKNLDISNPDQYETGMVSFKDFMIDQMELIPEALKENGYKVEVNLSKDNDGFIILIRNNAGLLPFEEERIKMRLTKAREYTDFSDIYMDIADDVEGEGLGIPLTMLFLRNSGIGDSSFRIASNGDITQSSFKIPLKTRTAELENAIKEKLVNEITELPTFPEHIIELQAMCRNRDVPLPRIASKISLDPALSASVLKLSNSALFMSPKKSETITDALKIIGLKNLNAILVASTTRKIMDERFSSFRDIWAHCNKCAFYTRLLAQKTGLSKISDSVFLSGLLHDLGKIVLLSANADLTRQIEDITVNRQMRTSTALEEVSMGISHSTLGRMIAERWNFPEFIVEGIAYHHSPLNPEIKNNDVVFITYIANNMCLIEENKFDFLFMEDEVLGRYGLEKREYFESLHENFKKQYEENPEEINLH